ncbi:MAG: outer membrane protein assembly factor [Rhodoferax sp.]|nr:outer membrane protein assembly factor [Rhodoferax sp.]
MTNRWVGGRVLTALLVACTLAAGCATPAQTSGSSPPASADATSAAPDAPAVQAFVVDVRAPDQIRDYLERHLDLLRYRTLADLDDTELERLSIAADRNVRDLLGTLGYFSPEVSIERDRAVAGAQTGRIVRIAVTPGPATVVESVAVSFDGAIADDPSAAVQRLSIRDGWTLPAGKPFTQQAWDAAKTQSLRLLAARRYPLGRIAASRAEIDPERHAARLSVTLASGPAFRLGTMRVEGLQRYEPELVERIARLKPGAVYDQSALIEAQQRLQDSGHFNSVVLEIDPQGDPQAVPIIATVSEARRNSIELGVGVSTDSGARLSAEHTNHQMPVLGWRAVSKLLLDNDTQSVQSEWTAPRDASLWQWQLFGQLKNEDAASVRVRSQQLRAGRLQRGEAIDRNYYVQYDRATTNGTGYQETAQTISANYAWTRRAFNRLPYPSSGYGLGVELGGGYTLGSQREPFTRARMNWLGIWSLASDTERQARASRIAVRAQAGAVLAKDGVSLPSTLLFLTGGDASVRGYSYHSIGASEANGITTPGRYLAGASVEWQRPILIDGQPSEWESTVFIDAGAVADKASALKAKVGIGAGVRYRSPVGPLQLDLAYGLDTRNLRLHLSVGFTF